MYNFVINIIYKVLYENKCLHLSLIIKYNDDQRYFVILLEVDKKYQRSNYAMQINEIIVMWFNLEEIILMIDNYDTKIVVIRPKI